MAGPFDPDEIKMNAVPEGLARRKGIVAEREARLSKPDEDLPQRPAHTPAGNSRSQ